MRTTDVLERFFTAYSEPEQDALIVLVEPPLGVLLTHIRVQIRDGMPVRAACQAALAPDSGNAPAIRESEVKAHA